MFLHIFGWAIFRALFSQILNFPTFCHYCKGPSINYVVSVGGRGVDPKTIYYIDPIFDKKDDKGTVLRFEVKVAV